MDSVLFWDIDHVDRELDAELVTERVIEFGTIRDFRTILSMYGYETVKNILLKNTRLSNRDLHFCSVFFDVDPAEFAAYKKKPATGKPLRFWNPAATE